ncbi:hypothetical protein JCM10213v2_007847 [Rhodosporidiobolus nylandii]
MATSPPGLPTRPASSQSGTSSSSTSAFDRAKAFRDRLNAARTNTSESGKASPPPTAVPGMPQPGSAQDRPPTGGRTTSDGISGGVMLGTGRTSSTANPALSSASLPGQAQASVPGQAFSSPPLPSGPYISPYPIPPSGFSSGYTPPNAYAPSSEPHAPSPVVTSPVLPPPQPAYPPGFVAPVQGWTPQHFTPAQSTPVTLSSPPAPAPVVSASPKDRTSAAATDGWEVVSPVIEQESVATVALSPLDEDRAERDARAAQHAEEKKEEEAVQARLDKTEAPCSPPILSTSAVPQTEAKSSAVASPVLSPALLPVAPAAAAAAAAPVKSSPSEVGTVALSPPAQASAEMPLSLPSAVEQKPPSPAPPKPASLPPKPVPSPAPTPAPPSQTTTHKVISLSRPTPAPVSTAPPSSASSALFSVAAFEAAHGGAQKAREFAAQTTKVPKEMLAALCEEGADAAVVLRRAERVEGELVRVWKNGVVPRGNGIYSKSIYLSSLESLLYLLLTLPSLPSFSSFTVGASIDAKAAPLVEALVDVLLRLTSVTAGSENATKDNAGDDEVKKRVEGAVDAWLREVKGLKDERERRDRDAARGTARTTAEELQTARIRVGKLDARVTALQEEAKASAEQVREWRDRAVKAEGRLGEKPSRRAELLLEQVNALTASKADLEAQLDTLQTSHNQLTRELEKVKSAALFAGTTPAASAASAAELDKLHARIAKLEADLARTEAAAEADQLIYDGKVEELQDKLKKVRAKLDGAQKEKERLEKEGREQKRMQERERKEAEKKSEDLKREVLRLRDREKQLELELASTDMPGRYPSSNDKAGASTSATAGKDAAALAATQEKITFLQQQLKIAHQDTEKDKFVIRKLVAQVRDLNAEVAERVEENSELMVRLAEVDSAGGA